jgi:hypothetical protein
MQYTLSLTTRMMTIAGLCLVLLCVLLFLLGIEIGKRVVVPADGAGAAPVAMPLPAASAVPIAPGDAPSAPGATKP